MQAGEDEKKTRKCKRTKGLKEKATKQKKHEVTACGTAGGKVEEKSTKGGKSKGGKLDMGENVRGNGEKLGARLANSAWDAAVDGRTQCLVLHLANNALARHPVHIFRFPHVTLLMISPLPLPFVSFPVC